MFCFLRKFRKSHMNSWKISHPDMRLCIWLWAELRKYFRLFNDFLYSFGCQRLLKFELLRYVHMEKQKCINQHSLMRIVLRASIKTIFQCINQIEMFSQCDIKQIPCNYVPRFMCSNEKQREKTIGLVSKIMRSLAFLIFTMKYSIS